MPLASFALALASCLFIQAPVQSCIPMAVEVGNPSNVPRHTGQAVDVAITAQAALVWDVETGTILYHKNEFAKRPIASLTKLATVLVVRDQISPNDMVIIPPDVSPAQRGGADIKLPVGQHTSVRDLLQATLVASANDAAVSLAVAVSGSEKQFVTTVNDFLFKQGFRDTTVTNATGLTEEGHYTTSTASEVRRLLELAYRDPVLQPFMSLPKGTLITTEGTKREYKTTNELLNSYLPILAAKTGYTVEAGENLAIITKGKEGQRIGLVVLGSEDRFRDMKVLVEWIWRNYSW